jgi:hypothetical protein
VSAIQTNLQGLLQKEVSRKGFLGIAGLALLSIFGFGTIFKMLTGKSLEGHHIPDEYTGSVYGGVSSKKERL